MPIQLSFIGYYVSQSFYSIIPRTNGVLYFNHFEVIVCLSMFPGTALDGLYNRFREVGKNTYKGYLFNSLKVLVDHGYITKSGTGYFLTDKSLVLISKVERKLQSILKEKGLIETKPVGRPNRGGNMKDL